MKDLNGNPLNADGTSTPLATWLALRVIEAEANLGLYGDIERMVGSDKAEEAYRNVQRDIRSGSKSAWDAIVRAWREKQRA